MDAAVDVSIEVNTATICNFESIEREGEHRNEEEESSQDEWNDTDKDNSKDEEEYYCKEDCKEYVQQPHYFSTLSDDIYQQDNIITKTRIIKMRFAMQGTDKGNKMFQISVQLPSNLEQSVMQMTYF